jgi:hypothetical protein
MAPKKPTVVADEVKHTAACLIVALSVLPPQPAVNAVDSAAIGTSKAKRFMCHTNESTLAHPFAPGRHPSLLASRSDATAQARVRAAFALLIWFSALADQVRLETILGGRWPPLGRDRPQQARHGVTRIPEISNAP